MDDFIAWIMGALAAVIPGLGEPETLTFYGTVEGELIMVSPEQGGRIVDIAVKDGDTVAAGTVLFRLDDRREIEALATARARLAAAQALWKDKTSGVRSEEIAVIEAQLQSAKADLVLAEITYKRTLELIERRVEPETRRDDTRAALDRATARVRQLKAELVVARLPRRASQVEAAFQDRVAAEAALHDAEIRLADRVVSAPANGRVERIYRLAGEMVAAGAPVLSLLPPDKVKVRFFIAEPQRGLIKVGASVRVGCSFCEQPIEARVTYVADKVEHTPPVIYSLDERAKLVFMVEAQLAPGHGLAPGQPVDVRPAE